MPTVDVRPVAPASSPRKVVWVTNQVRLPYYLSTHASGWSSVYGTQQYIAFRATFQLACATPWIAPVFVMAYKTGYAGISASTRAEDQPPNGVTIERAHAEWPGTDAYRNYNSANAGGTLLASTFGSAGPNARRSIYIPPNAGVFVGDPIAPKSGVSEWSPANLGAGGGRFSYRCAIDLGGTGQAVPVVDATADNGAGWSERVIAAAMSQVAAVNNLGANAASSGLGSNFAAWPLLVGFVGVPSDGTQVVGAWGDSLTEFLGSGVGSGANGPLTPEQFGSHDRGWLEFAATAGRFVSCNMGCASDSLYACLNKADAAGRDVRLAMTGFCDHVLCALGENDATLAAMPTADWTEADIWPGLQTLGKLVRQAGSIPHAVTIGPHNASTARGIRERVSDQIRAGWAGAGFSGCWDVAADLGTVNGSGGNVFSTTHPAGNPLTSDGVHLHTNNGHHAKRDSLLAYTRAQGIART